MRIRIEVCETRVAKAVVTLTDVDRSPSVPMDGRGRLATTKVQLGSWSHGGQSKGRMRYLAAEVP